jgi:hypothetical protein
MKQERDKSINAVAKGPRALRAGESQEGLEQVRKLDELSPERKHRLEQKNAKPAK